MVVSVLAAACEEMEGGESWGIEADALKVSSMEFPV